MSEQTTNPGNAHDLRALLAVVLEALTLPYGADDYDRRILERAALTRTVVAAALAEAPADLAWNADYLSGKLAAEQADAEEREKNRCGRCRKPFDQDDTAFDGRARHADTPHCRGCVDNCHEGSAEHVCVICDPKRYGGSR
ncbi:hypothetical protein [Streptomyces griseiscabiei]|uniref:HNH endonuclease n=1 Tax=Streptomyces griseiscabiei TaxID=2993540 RepID=A0ABU4LCF6_9ACTN|nr:hypothetical protein [Streptomyces griseiscabiei]MBZ3907320.1 hypothetical protein [Streptomyces griseiscabiei]MDX2913412.1 hypothetical protein [Streptomyces griseiscabiei]